MAIGNCARALSHEPHQHTLPDEPVDKEEVVALLDRGLLDAGHLVLRAVEQVELDRAQEEDAEGAEQVYLAQDRDPLGLCGHKERDRQRDELVADVAEQLSDARGRRRGVHQEVQAQLQDREVQRNKRKDRRELVVQVLRVERTL